MEGKLLERVTKATRSKRIKYAENYFNVGELKPIVIFGEETKPLPESVCVNLAPNSGWTILTETNDGDILFSANGEEVAIQLDLATVPITSEPEEVNQEDDEEIENGQNANGDTGHLTSNGLVKIVPNMPPSETDTASTGVVRD